MIEIGAGQVFRHKAIFLVHIIRLCRHVRIHADENKGLCSLRHRVPSQRRITIGARTNMSCGIDHAKGECLRYSFVVIYVFDFQPHVVLTSRCLRHCLNFS